jgi:hypothetical protein
MYVGNYSFLMHLFIYVSVYQPFSVEESLTELFFISRGTPAYEN